MINAATRLFATNGYDGTSIEAVLAECGTSRGSLYHHFPGKEALFFAVLETLEVRVVEALDTARAGIDDPVEALRASCLAWIHLAGDPEIQQIVLTDAPAVLGWRRFRELDEQTVLGEIRIAVDHAAHSGRVDSRHVDVFAHLIMAAVNEAAIMVTRADDPPTALPEAQNAFDEFLRRVLS